jgi:hypothetical protein
MPKGASYRSLALSLIGDVKTQWSTLCSFVDSFYIELTAGVADVYHHHGIISSQC